VTAARRPRVVVLRGHNVNPWDLRPWQLLDDFDVTVLVTRSNEFTTDGIGLPVTQVRSIRDRLPHGRPGRALAYAVGDRYLGLARVLAGAEIVHAAEIHTWFSAQAAALRARLDFRLVLTAWETIPFMESYRWPRERRYRRQVLGKADLILPATDRARRALLLEGLDDQRLLTCYPGIDTSSFASTAESAVPHEHLILSPGRLVWEKGHQDVIRALAALQRGLAGRKQPVRLMIVGSGPEERRLKGLAAELGVGGLVEFRAAVPYDEMPSLYAAASTMVLASLPRRGWEEQFGMVLAEALASGTSIIASRSGAIPEVLADNAPLFEPGDWFGLARLLAAGPLSRPPAARVPHDPERIEMFSLEAAAERLAGAYRSVLA